MFPPDDDETSNVNVNIPLRSYKSPEPEANRNNMHLRSRRMNRTVKVVGLVTLTIISIAATVSLVYFSRNKSDDSKTDDTTSSTGNDLITPFLCPEKMVQITHICEVPDLDTGFDSTMDISMLVDNQRHWPQSRSVDCLDEYGYYQNTCIIPDSLLIDCFELTNSKEWKVENNTLGNNMKVTIHETDPFFDDSIDIYISRDQWYNGDECDTKQYVFNSTSTTAYIRMSVSPLQAPKTDGDTSSPTPSPPSGPNSIKYYEEKCGIPILNITNGLAQVPQKFTDMQQALADYGNINNRRVRDRALLWNFLVSSVSSFVSFAFRSAVSQGPMSSLADVCTIASTINTALEPDGPDIQALFDQVNERFDAIDNKLDDINSLVLEGFRELKMVINEAFAEQELDDWITNGHLSILQDDYKAFMNPNHTPETKLKYESIFRTSCQETHAPYTIFKFLYSNTCSTCDKLGGRSNQYILDSYITRANDSFDSIPDRIKSFRKGFVQLMISSMMQTFYLHSVCLYQDSGVCQNLDPVWLERLGEMASAMEESALSLSRSEERLKCKYKYVKVVHICDFKRGGGTNCGWFTAGMTDRYPYWPTAIDQCPAGGYRFDRPNCKLSGSCIIPTDDIEPVLFTSGKVIQIYTDEECDEYVWRLNRIEIPASDWYDEYECGEKIIEQNDGEVRFKIQIDSVPTGYPPSDSL